MYWRLMLINYIILSIIIMVMEILLVNFRFIINYFINTYRWLLLIINLYKLFGLLIARYALLTGLYIYFMSWNIYLMGSYIHLLSWYIYFMSRNIYLAISNIYLLSRSINLMSWYILLIGLYMHLISRYVMLMRLYIHLMIWHILFFELSIDIMMYLWFGNGLRTCITYNFLSLYHLITIIMIITNYIIIHALHLSNTLLFDIMVILFNQLILLWVQYICVVLYILSRHHYIISYLIIYYLLC